MFPFSSYSNHVARNPTQGSASSSSRPSVSREQPQTRHQALVGKSAERGRFDLTELERPTISGQEHGHHTIIASAGVLHCAAIAIDDQPPLFAGGS